jgi:hypothetical protein
MASLAAAVVCLLSAFVAYGTVALAERVRAKLAARRKRAGISIPTTVALPRRPAEIEDLPAWADALNSDLGHVYEPAATTSPLAREAEYGWPLEDTVVITSEPLHELVVESRLARPRRSGAGPEPQCVPASS